MLPNQFDLPEGHPTSLDILDAANEMNGSNSLEIALKVRAAFGMPVVPDMRYSYLDGLSPYQQSHPVLLKLAAVLRNIETFRDVHENMLDNARAHKSARWAVHNLLNALVPDER
jgi:hypothetical protein